MQGLHVNPAVERVTLAVGLADRHPNKPLPVILGIFPNMHWPASSWLLPGRWPRSKNFSQAKSKSFHQSTADDSIEEHLPSTIVPALNAQSPARLQSAVGGISASRSRGQHHLQRCRLAFDPFFKQSPTLVSMDPCHSKGTW
ncbi:unnamed protein product [Linum trigynum]|uniref:Uncharacterized protein n=1 Tax=Linum trigynum TaxID=586398 RepID=A0AAV2FCP4_9ROSI